MLDITTPLFKVFMPESIKDEMTKTLFSGYIAEGPKVAEFTKMLSEYIGNPRTVVVNSGTSALTLAYRLAGVGPGTEVISTPLTCAASNTPILELGGKVVWVDCESETGMVDPDDIEHLITDKTKAICILHKEGDPAKLDEILSIANKHKIKVVEDCAHALGSKYKGTMIGNHGDYCCFSLQAIKHITTGDGGALLCKNADDYERAKRLKWFGVDRDKVKGREAWLHDVPEWGYKMNLNDVAATIGVECMKHIEWIIKSFHENGEYYNELLKNISGLKLIKRDPENYSAYWAYCLIVENRSNFIKKLADEGIASDQIHPRNDVYSMFSGSKRKLPGVDYFASREVSIPSGWWVTGKEIERICKIIKNGW